MKKKKKSWRQRPVLNTLPDEPIWR
jgi:hypothetical protein